MSGVDLAGIAWRLDAGAAHWLTADELSRVTAWMDDNGVERATAQRPVDVTGGTITYGQDRASRGVQAADREIVTLTVPLRTAPPEVYQPTCGPDALAAVQATLEEHEWSPVCDGACVDCSTASGERGRSYARREDVVPWPCPPVHDAFVQAGLPVRRAPQFGPRFLGDTLSPELNALAFGVPD